MSYCRRNVIFNSKYSYCGHFYNKLNDKIVIVPIMASSVEIHKDENNAKIIVSNG